MRTFFKLTADEESVRYSPMKTVRATNLRRNLYETLRSVARTGEPVEIVLRGQSTVTIVKSPESPPTSRKPLLDLDAISEFCQRHDIKSFSLFGSILRPDFDAESDIDVLVDSGEPSDFHAWCEMVRELEHLFGRRVDLVPTTAIPRMNRYRQKSITSSAREIYRAQAA
jgi:hypothetical protein